MKKITSIVFMCMCLVFVFGLSSALPLQAPLREVITPPVPEETSRWIEETQSTDLSYIMRDNERDVIYLADAANQELVLIDSITEEVLERLSIPDNTFSDMAMSKDNTTLAIVGGSVVLIDTETLDMRVLSINENVNSAAFDYKGNLYFSIIEEYWGQNEDIQYYDMETDTIINIFANYSRDHSNPLLKTDKEGKFLYVGERNRSPASLYKYDVSGEEPVFLVEDDHGDLGSYLKDFVIAPDGKKVYMACGAPYGIQVIDSETIKRIALLETGPYPGGVDLDKYGMYVYGTPTSNPYNNVLYQFKRSDESLTTPFDLLADVGNGAPGIRGVAVDRTGKKAFIIHGNTYYKSFKVQVVDTDVDMCAEAIKALEEELAVVTAENEQLQAENSGLTQQNAQLQDQVVQLSQQVEELEAENANLKAQVESKDRYIQMLWNFIRWLIGYVQRMR